MRFKIYLLFLLVSVFVINAHAQLKLFTYQGILKADAKNLVTKGTKLKLDRNLLQTLYASKPEEVRIVVPVENENLVIKLTRKDLFSHGFEVILSGTLETYKYTPGYYLQGTVEGAAHSLAAISIFNDYAGGIISYKGNVYNLVIANNRNNYQDDNYIIYADKDYLAPRPKCFTEDSNEPIHVNKNIPVTSSFIGCPVDIYFETGYDMYQQLGSVVGVMNYFTILFNAEQTLYANENIMVQIREVTVWTTIDPEYSLTNTTDALNSFRNRMFTSGFNGDLAHYVTFNNLGGGRGALDVLCYPVGSGTRTAVSGNLFWLDAPYPNYSFSVNVITHENGHNLGSPHTHSCTWPGGAIDDCYTTEGGCPPGPTPTSGGTIMSYCHLISTGIDFANGFGPLPGDLIRDRVTTATASGCICDCGNIQLDITKQDIGCGNPTGTATAVVTGGTGPFAYAWSNGANGANVTGLATGTYYLTVTGATPTCRVVKGFKILNSGNAVTVSLNPSATSVSKCLNETYNISATISPVGTYTYQWYKDGLPIAGATTTSVSITSAVNSTASYYLTATGATCIGQSASVTVTFQSITAPVITASGSTTICNGQSVVLSIPASSFLTEWRLNNVPIAGATNTSYTATAAGSYIVRNYSSTTASCTATSSPVTITVLPVPGAATDLTAVAFCTGQNAIVTHSALAGETYTWYKNNILIPGETNNTLTITTGGNYYIKVQGANGCSSSGTDIVATENPLPDVVLNPASTVSLCDGGTLSLHAVALSQGQYEWYDGTQLLSDAGNILTVTHSGSYSVHITNLATGCSNSSLSTNVSISPPPAIQACNDTTISTGQSYTLSVHELTSIGVDHFEWTPSTGLNNPYISNPVATLQHDQEYTVKGIYPSGCIATDKVLIKVIKGPAIYVPLSFTPNGDTKNDLLRCTAVGLSSFKYFDVYNRYGQRVFHTEDLSKGWDGKWKGQPMGIGTYVYIAEGVDYRGKQIIAKGTVTILF